LPLPLALLLGALTLAGGAGAATLTVTNLADSGPGTLRQRIAEAQPNDTIDFAATFSYKLTNPEMHA
jgi:hypothetical protein